MTAWVVSRHNKAVDRFFGSYAVEIRSNRVVLGFAVDKKRQQFNILVFLLTSVFS